MRNSLKASNGNLGGWVDGVSGLSFTTTSTNSAWTPTTVTKSGGTLTWNVLSSAGALVLSSTANKPTFNLSSHSGTKTIRVTSPDGWAGLSALEFNGVAARISTINLKVATSLASLTLLDLPDLTWTVSSSSPVPQSLTYMLLSLITVNWTVGASAPMPPSLTFLYLASLSAGFVWTVGAGAQVPTGLTYLLLQTLPGVSWTVGAGAPFPTTLVNLNLIDLSGLAAITAWNGINAIGNIVYENGLSQAAVDAVLSAIWSNKANFTNVLSPSLDLDGESNSTPGGVYQAASPPTTGREFAYDLVNGAYTSAGPEWTVTYAP